VPSLQKHWEDFQFSKALKSSIENISTWAKIFFEWCKNLWKSIKEKTNKTPASCNLPKTVPAPILPELPEQAGQVKGSLEKYFQEPEFKGLRVLLQKILLANNILKIKREDLDNKEKGILKTKITVTYKDPSKIKIVPSQENAGLTDIVMMVGRFLAEFITSINLPKELEIEITSSELKKHVEIKGLSIDIQRDKEILDNLRKRLEDLGRSTCQALQGIKITGSDDTQAGGCLAEPFEKLKSPLIPKKLTFDLRFDLIKFESKSIGEVDWKLIFDFIHKFNVRETAVSIGLRIFKDKIRGLEQMINSCFLSQLNSDFFDYFNNNFQIKTGEAERVALKEKPRKKEKKPETRKRSPPPAVFFGKI